MFVKIIFIFIFLSEGSEGWQQQRSKFVETDFNGCFTLEKHAIKMSLLMLFPFLTFSH